MSEVLLLGDSHLARIRGDRRRALQEATGHSVTNAAVGGADARDVIGQVPAEVDAPVVVVSVGTNDAAPWKLHADVFERDGLHLNDCGYDVLLEALADVIQVAAARR